MEEIQIRSELEMLDLILKTAKDDERVRLVIMNGSRTSPNAPKDRFQDYDIVYIVKRLESFVSDHSWINIFGDPIMIQMPETHELIAPINDGRFNYQILFDDENRLDLTLIPIESLKDILQPDTQTKLLLDKDNIMLEIPPCNDSDYYITIPTQKLFNDCCNNFWWVLQNVAKGICRDELPYAMKMIEYDRTMLDCMASWFIGTTHGYQITTGKCGKYFKKYLDPDIYQMYCDTHSNSNYNNLWASVFTMCKLFRKLAFDVANYSGFSYKHEDDKNMTEYLGRVHALNTGNGLITKN